MVPESSESINFLVDTKIATQKDALNNYKVCSHALFVRQTGKEFLNFFLLFN